MPIPGVGFQEVVIILIAALMIFGPAKLPELMGQAGKALRDFRKMTGNLQGEFEKNLNEAAGTDVRKTLSTEIAGLRNEVQGAADSISGKPVAKTTTARPATTTTKPATPAGSKATTTGATKTTTAAVGSAGTSSTGTASAAAAVAEAEASGEIEFVPVRTTSRRGSSSSPARPLAAARPASTAAPATGSTVTDVRPRQSGSSGVSGADRETGDPFARARSRRQSAGYQR